MSTTPFFPSISLAGSVSPCVVTASLSREFRLSWVAPSAYSRRRKPALAVRGQNGQKRPPPTQRCARGSPSGPAAPPLPPAGRRHPRAPVPPPRPAPGPRPRRCALPRVAGARAPPPSARGFVAEAAAGPERAGNEAAGPGRGRPAVLGWELAPSSPAGLGGGGTSRRGGVRSGRSAPSASPRASGPARPPPPRGPSRRALAPLPGCICRGSSLAGLMLPPRGRRATRLARLTAAPQLEIRESKFSVHTGMRGSDARRCRLSGEGRDERAAPPGSVAALGRGRDSPR